MAKRVGCSARLIAPAVGNTVVGRVAGTKSDPLFEVQL
jgi:hypothetical protein